MVKLAEIFYNYHGDCKVIWIRMNDDKFVPNITIVDEHNDLKEIHDTFEH